MRVITVKCPKCRETLEVDAATGAVVRSCGEVRTKPGEDFLGTRLRQLDEEKQRRENLVAEGREREKAKKSEFDKLFSKVREENASGAAAERPTRDIDLD